MKNLKLLKKQRSKLYEMIIHRRRKVVKESGVARGRTIMIEEKTTK